MYDLVEADDGHEGDDEVGEEARDQHARSEQPEPDVDVRLHQVRQLFGGLS